nr:PREDICTED: uncharacterized protein LOC109037196 [Bemisia tabaci]
MSSNEDEAAASRAEHNRAAQQFKTKRNLLVEQVRATRDAFRLLTDETVEHHRARCDKLKILQARFEEFQDQAIEMNSLLCSNNQIELSQAQADFDRIHNEAAAVFLSKVLKATRETTFMNNTSFSTTFIRLPKLELPKFSGDLGNWRTWHNLYKASVHTSPSLLGVQKFQYLIGSLKGDALALVTGLDITAENYEVAWKLLCDRYHSERRHVFFHFHGLLDLPDVKHSEQIPPLITKIREHSQALQALGHAPDTYAGLLTAHIIRKLSYRLRQRLEDYRGADSTYPKLEELMEFLEKERRGSEDTLSNRKETRTLVTSQPKNAGGKPWKSKPSGETVLTATSTPEDEPDKSSSSHQKDPQCPLCLTTHRLRLCPTFQAKSAADRRSYIEASNRCFNCLGLHKVSQCSNTGTCSECGRKHNTMLHEENPPTKKALTASLVHPHNAS